MKFTFTFKFFTFLFLSSFVNQLHADETTAMLRLIVAGEKVNQGECLLSVEDFSTAKFSIVDDQDELLEKFKIVEGTVDWEASRNSVYGKVLADGKLDARAIDIIGLAKGKRLNFTIKTHFGPNLLERTWKFHVYIDVVPQLVFGSIEDGEMDVPLTEVKELRTVSVLFKERPDLVKFRVIKGMVTVKGLQGSGAILQNGQLHIDAIRLLQSAKGREVTVLVLYKDPSGKETKSSLVFRVAG